MSGPVLFSPCVPYNCVVRVVGVYLGIRYYSRFLFVKYANGFNGLMPKPSSIQISPPRTNTERAATGPGLVESYVFYPHVNPAVFPPTVVKYRRRQSIHVGGPYKLFEDICFYWISKHLPDTDRTVAVCKIYRGLTLYPRTCAQVGIVLMRFVHILSIV